MSRFPMLQLPTFLLGIFLVSVALSQSPSPVSPAKSIFTDVTQESGITWSQFSGESPDRFLIETMGGGVGFLDFDGATDDRTSSW